MSDFSQCTKCYRVYPSAPPDHIHKCGQCSGGRCVPMLPRIRELSKRAAPLPWVGYSEPEVGLFLTLFSGTPMQTGFAPVNADAPENVGFIVACVSYVTALLERGS